MDFFSLSQLLYCSSDSRVVTTFISASGCGIMLPSVPPPTRSQIRNAKRKRQRQLRSIRDTIQKNHIARLERELIVTHDSAKKSAGENASLKLAVDRYIRLGSPRLLYRTWDAFRL